MDERAQDIEQRRLRFEARRFAIETLVRIQLDQATGTRTLVASHLRLMFGLSLGAIAGAVTVIGASLRAGEAISLHEDGPEVGLIALCLVLFTTAAILALIRSRAVARQSASILMDPFPTVEKDVRRILSTCEPSDDEESVLDTLSRVLIARVEADRLVRTNSTLVVVLIFGGLVCGGIGVVLQFLE